MSGGTKAAGDRGEAAVARYLEERGCMILVRQWRCRCGELDLVVREQDGTVCFVEVKLRGDRAIGLPREFVDGRKQARLRQAAAAYLVQNDMEDTPARFDVAEVYAKEDGALQVEYLEDAFI